MRQQPISDPRRLHFQLESTNEKREMTNDKWKNYLSQPPTNTQYFTEFQDCAGDRILFPNAQPGPSLVNGAGYSGRRVAIPPAHAATPGAEYFSGRATERLKHQANNLHRDPPSRPLLGRWLSLAFASRPAPALLRIPLTHCPRLERGVRWLKHWMLFVEVVAPNSFLPPPQYRAGHLQLAFDIPYEHLR